VSKTPDRLDQPRPDDIDRLKFMGSLSIIPLSTPPNKLPIIVQIGIIIKNPPWPLTCLNMALFEPISSPTRNTRKHRTIVVEEFTEAMKDSGINKYPATAPIVTAANIQTVIIVYDPSSLYKNS